MKRQSTVTFILASVPLNAFFILMDSLLSLAHCFGRHPKARALTGWFACALMDGGKTQVLQVDALSLPQLSSNITGECEWHQSNIRSFFRLSVKDNYSLVTHVPYSLPGHADTAYAL